MSYYCNVLLGNWTTLLLCIYIHLVLFLLLILLPQDDHIIQIFLRDEKIASEAEVLTGTALSESHLLTFHFLSEDVSGSYCQGPILLS